MNRSSFMANRLREVLLNGRWIANTNYKDQLSDLNWQEATQKTGNLNTIAALVFHINYYLAGLIAAFESGRLEIRDRYSFDLPPIRSEAGWSALVAELLGNAESFARAVEQMEDHRLDESFVDERYGTFLRNIEAVIEHCYYHLGQVTLLKKLVRQEGLK